MSQKDISAVARIERSKIRERSRGTTAAPGFRFCLRALRFGKLQTLRSSQSERRRVAQSGLRSAPPPRPSRAGTPNCYSSQDMHDETHSDGPQFADARGRLHPLPLFMPVYQPRQPTFQLARDGDGLTIDGLIVNAFFLYKQRELRKTLTTGTTLQELVGFDGLISTDSGAFQGFSRALYLKNRDIVRFQDQIRSDIIAPLDLVTPPGNSRTTAQSRLDVTNNASRGDQHRRHGIVAGVQQGGRFLDFASAAPRRCWR